MPSICLNMIVKNEAPVIRRCLDSVRPLISTWCILDTGSTDGTQELIREHFRDLPGQLHQSDWKGFGASRSEAIQLARPQADYLFFIDADAELILPAGYRLPELTEPCYEFAHRLADTTFFRRDLVSTRLDWRYVGVLHEYIDCGLPCPPNPIRGPLVQERPEGARSRDPLKYQKDVLTLERALRDEPQNERYQFYLAQSQKDAGQLERAVASYRRRAAMGGWGEEVYISLLRVAELLEVLDRPESEVLGAYLDAHEARPARAECLAGLARYLRGRRKFHLAALFAGEGMARPIPGDRLFVVESCHTWRCLDEFAVAAYWCGRHQECLEACDRLLAEGFLPAEEVERVRANRAFAARALGLVAEPPDPPRAERTLESA